MKLFGLDKTELELAIAEGASRVVAAEPVAPPRGASFVSGHVRIDRLRGIQYNLDFSVGDQTKDHSAFRRIALIRPLGPKL